MVELVFLCLLLIVYYSFIVVVAVRLTGTTKKAGVLPLAVRLALLSTLIQALLNRGELESFIWFRILLLFVAEFYLTFMAARMKWKLSTKRATLVASRLAGISFVVSIVGGFILRVFLS